MIPINPNTGYYTITVTDPDYYLDNSILFSSIFGCLCHQYEFMVDRQFCLLNPDELEKAFGGFEKYIHWFRESKSFTNPIPEFEFKEAFYSSRLQFYISPDRKAIVGIESYYIKANLIHRIDGQPFLPLQDGFLLQGDDGDEIRQINRFFIQCAAQQDLVEIANICYGYVNKMIQTYHKTLDKFTTKAYVHLIYVAYDSLRLKQKEIRKVEYQDLEYCYNTSFYDVDLQIKTKLLGEKSGLLVLHGIPGSGKTNYIRHLVWHINAETKEECTIILINGEQISLILRPDFIEYLSEVSSERMTFLILEDCEQLIKMREKDDFYNRVAEILNISDGLYSDIFKIKIIATFNTDTSNIDPALLRPGRLIERVFFDNLDDLQANLLLRKLGSDKYVEEPLSLAEVFEMVRN